MMIQNENTYFQLLVPGKKLENDWCNFPVPTNIEVGENTVIDSSSVFKSFYSKLPLGLKVGNHVTLQGASLAAQPGAYIEIGDYCFLGSVSVVAEEKIVIGNYVYIAGGVTIVDSDFHPIDPGERLRDTIAISPVGDKKRRPHFECLPVYIEDDVWIGFNATILKGVTIGKGAIINPGSVVSKNVAPGSVVEGNPATVKNKNNE